jgi:hypothetical protein
MLRRAEVTVEAIRAALVPMLRAIESVFAATIAAAELAALRAEEIRRLCERSLESDTDLLVESKVTPLTALLSAMDAALDAVEAAVLAPAAVNVAVEIKTLCETSLEFAREVAKESALEAALAAVFAVPASVPAEVPFESAKDAADDAALALVTAPSAWVPADVPLESAVDACVPAEVPWLLATESVPAPAADTAFESAIDAWRAALSALVLARLAALDAADAFVTAPPA